MSLPNLAQRPRGPRLGRSFRNENSAKGTIVVLDKRERNRSFSVAKFEAKLEIARRGRSCSIWGDANYKKHEEGTSRLCDVITLQSIFSRSASRLESKFDLTSRRRDTRKKLLARHRKMESNVSFEIFLGSSEA